MDEGPFRAPQPVERRVPSREALARQTEKPQPAKESPQVSRRVEIPSIHEPKKHRLFKRVLLPIIIILVVLGIGLGGWTIFSKAQNSAATGIDASKYQAVFFTNGEVYFGKLQSFNDKYMKLTDIFYLHSDSTTASTSQNTSTDSTDAQLIKLGNEAYGPEDAMIISRDQVSRYMNLKPDSKVVQLIDKYTAK